MGLVRLDVASSDLVGSHTRSEALKGCEGPPIAVPSSETRESSEKRIEITDLALGQANDGTGFGATE